MTNKMTNRKALEYVLTNCDIPADVREKLVNMTASLEKKSSTTNRKPTAKQTENANLRNIIYDYLLNSGVKASCTEIGKSIPELEGMNNQRISALLRPLVTEGVVLKDKVKGVSVFYAQPRDADED